MLINVGNIVTSSGFSQSFTVLRKRPGEYVDGLYVEGRICELLFKGSVQPATTKDLAFLEEGQRTKEHVKFIARERLRTADEIDGTVADVALWGCRQWRIINVKNWGSNGYYRCIGEQLKNVC